MKNKIKRIVIGLCLVTGIALCAVPFYYHFHGKSETDKLIKKYENAMEVTEYETEEKEEIKEQTGISQEDAAILSGEDVIGIIEIETIDIRYPVLEGAGTTQMRYAIGHISETAGIGEKGNCVLCGHNGSRNGIFFTNLSQLSKGDIVKVMDKEGTLFLYEVMEGYVVEANDNSVKNQSEEEILTLLTCAENGTKRYALRCRLQN